MIRFSSLGLALILFLCGCHRESSHTSLMERPALSRPIVGVNALMIAARHELPWDLSQELTRAIRLHLTKQNRLYLLSEDQVATLFQKITQQQDPFSTDVQWIKKIYPQNEFVSFFELVEHHETPISQASDSPAELSIAIKVHVFDLRGKTPQPVLQEIVRQTHHIPAQFTHNPKTQTSSQVSWGAENFEISPLGLAHEKLCLEIANRVEEYILLSCEKP